MRLTRLTPVLLLAVAVAAILLVRSGGPDGHSLYFNTADASGAIAGQEVRLAGHKVGKVETVTPVDGGRRASIKLRIRDEAWPVRTGSHVTIRWGGTVSYLKRYVALKPGPASGAPFADGATLPTAAVTTPVDFDELINQFTPKIRDSYSTFINVAGGTLTRSAPRLRKVVTRTPEALGEANLLLRSLARSRTDLHALIASADDVTRAIQTADPSVDQAVEGAALTLAATSRHTDGIRQTLHALPGTLDRVRTTLGRADRTLDLAKSATGRIAPGVTELRRTVTPLNGLLRRVNSVAPVATSTLTTARTAAPDLTRLLQRATGLLPDVRSVADQANTQLQCIRPYTPDIVQLGTNWSGFISAVDTKDYYARVNPAVLAFAPTNVESSSTADVARRFPGLRYGFPRPPGDSAGQPWFLPECGAGPDAINPFKDYEARSGANGR
jgi:phospholipid/cholesterol/gamma-HCH transport system substrate-binding protein